MKKLLFVILAVMVAFAPTASATYTERGTDIGPTGIVFEGATEDAFKTTVAITDPTVARTITIPDSNQTVGTASTVGNDTVGADQLADEDLGEVVVASGVVSIDDDVIDADTLADGDLGDVSVSSGVVSLDAGVCVYGTEIVTFVPADGANTACDTTCGVATAVVAYDAGTSAFVATNDASADSCVCDGATS